MLKVFNYLLAHRSVDLTYSLTGTPIFFHEYNRTLTLHRHVSLAELARHKRQYVKSTGVNSSTNDIDIGTNYIDFLAVSM